MKTIQPQKLAGISLSVIAILMAAFAIAEIVFFPVTLFVIASLFSGSIDAPASPEKWDLAKLASQLLAVYLAVYPLVYLMTLGITSFYWKKNHKKKAFFVLGIPIYLFLLFAMFVVLT